MFVIDFQQQQDANTNLIGGIVNQIISYCANLTKGQCKIGKSSDIHFEFQYPDALLNL